MKIDFQKIENLLSRLINSFEKNFNASEAQEVQDFIDVGEFGLALETLVDIICEEDKKISEEIFNSILKLVAAMDMDQRVFHEKLQTRIE